MIGLIFGETDFPKYIYGKIKNKKKYIIIDLTKKRVFHKDKYSYPVSIGQFGKIISILKKNKCRKVLFAGKVEKPNFSRINLDFKGVYYFPRIIKKSKLGDAAILKEIIKILKSEKIQTISSTTFTPELNLSKGNYTKHKPDKKDKVEISKALKALKKSNQYDHTTSSYLYYFPDHNLKWVLNINYRVSSEEIVLKFPSYVLGQIPLLQKEF